MCVLAKHDWIPSELTNFFSVAFFVVSCLHAVYTTHTEITNFLQGSIDNEANLNPTSTCTATCSDYRTTQHYQCQSGSLCDRSVNDHEPAKCAGVLRECRPIDESDLTICETVRVAAATASNGWKLLQFVFGWRKAPISIYASNIYIYFLCFSYKHRANRIDDTIT